MATCNEGTVIPVNNDPIKCEELISSDCSIFENAIAYLSLPANSSMTQVILALLASLVDARNRIYNLENPN